MNIQIFGPGPESRRQLLTQVALSLGHTVATPADAVFLMDYPKNVPVLAEAARLGKQPTCLWVLRTRNNSVMETAFWRSGLVVEIVDTPITEFDVIQLFREVNIRLAAAS
jgi:hypothetical protein